MNINTTKEIEVDFTLDAVFDNNGRRVPVENFSTDNDGDLIIDLGVRMPTPDENKILDYLELKDITLDRLHFLLEADPF